MSAKTLGRIVSVSIGVAVATCAVWRAVHSQPDLPDAAIALVGEELRTGGMGCGPAALVAAVSAHDAEAGLRLRRMLERDELAARPVSSLYDLATWAGGVGLEPVGLEVAAEQLSRLPLPAVVHVRPGHFLALLVVGEDRVVVADQDGVLREISRRDFDRRFSGYVLCFKQFLERHG